MDPNVLLLTVSQSRPTTSPSDARVATPQGGDGDFLGFLRQFGGQVDQELFQKVFSAANTTAMQSPFPRVNPMPLPVMPVVDGKLADGTAALKTPATASTTSMELGFTGKGTADGKAIVEQKLRKAKEVSPEALMMALPVALVAVQKNQPQPNGDTPLLFSEPEPTEAAADAQPNLPVTQAVAQALAMQAQSGVTRGRAVVQPEGDEEAAVDNELEGDLASDDEMSLEPGTEPADTDGLPQLPAPPLAIEQGQAGHPHPEMPDAAILHAKSQASDRAQAMMPSAVREAVVKERPVETTDLPLPVTDGDETPQTDLAGIRRNEQPTHDKLGHEQEIIAEVAMTSQDAATVLTADTVSRETRPSAPDSRVEALSRHFAEAGLRIVNASAPDAGAQQRTGDGTGGHSRFIFANEGGIAAKTTPAAPEMIVPDQQPADDTTDNTDRISADVLANRVEMTNTATRPAAHSREARIDAVEPRQVIDQIVTAVRQESVGGRRELVVRLDPPELGTVHIKVSSDAGGGMTVQVETTAPWVRDMLDTRLQELRRSFTDLGINVDQCGVSMRMDTSPEQANYGQAGAQHRQPAHTPHANPDLTAPIDAEPVKARHGHNGVLDMLA